MLARSVALLLAELGVTKTQSRPHVSNDNPYSESQFKTLKYHPEFPELRGGFLLDFFLRYNTMHHHSALGWLTPWGIHHGMATTRLAEREAVSQQAFAATPERFVRGAPIPLALPQAVWMNRPRMLDTHDPAAVARDTGSRWDLPQCSPMGAEELTAVH